MSEKRNNSDTEMTDVESSQKDVTMDDAPALRANATLVRLDGVMREEFPDGTFYELYEKMDRIASGSYATVYTCKPRSSPDGNSMGATQPVYAVKIMERAKIKKKDVVTFYKEVSLLKALAPVQNVVKLIDHFAERNNLYMIEEYIPGGDVFDRLSERHAYTEKNARTLAKILLQTIVTLHKFRPKAIIHRDIKPENLLLRNNEDDTSIVLADFGFARFVRDGDQCHTRCGTPSYVAPEVVLGVPYGIEADNWSIGCLLYMLICGYPPFQANNHRVLFRKIRAADFVFHDMYWKDVSLEAKRVVSGMLTVSSSNRLTAEQALQSDWFVETATADEAYGNIDLTDSLEEMRKEKSRRIWKKAAHAIGFAATARFWNPDAVSFANQMKQWDIEEHAAASIKHIFVKKVLAKRGAENSADKLLIHAKPVRLYFRDIYELKEKISDGSHSTVWNCIHRKTGNAYAVKVISRAGLTPQDDEAVLNEVAILQSLWEDRRSRVNNYIVQLMDFYEEPNNFYLVFDYLAGGDLFERIVDLTHYTEQDARKLAASLLKAVALLHEGGIAHRDIKPQNLLLKNVDDPSSIKVGDFGFARRVHTPSSLTSRVGTPTYVAPEILKNVPHDQRVDMWSVGVVLYVLLVGYPPFMEDDQSTLFSKIRSGDWDFKADDWKHISEDAKELISGLLVVDPKDRWTAEEALRSPWFEQDARKLSEVVLTDSLRVLREKKPKLRMFSFATRWIRRMGSHGKHEDEAKPYQIGQHDDNENSPETGCSGVAVKSVLTALALD